VGIDTHVTSCSAEGFSLSVWYMLLGLGVTILLSHTKVDDMNQIGMWRAGFANQKVVGLDITVNEVLLMNRLHSSQLLIVSMNRQARDNQRRQVLALKVDRPSGKAEK